MVVKYKRAKINTNTVEALNPGEAISDTHLPGYYVRCQKEARIYFIRKYALGHRHFVNIGEHGKLGLTEKRARDQAQKIIVEIKQGGDPTQERNSLKQMPTLSAYADEYLDGYGLTLKPSTLQDYRNCFNRYIRPLSIANSKLDRITRQDIAQLHRSKSKHKRTANKLLQILSSMYGEAQRAGIVPSEFNPTKGIKHYKIDARQRFLSQDELMNLGQALSEAEDHGSENLYAIAAIRLLIYTGARLNEILTLRWEWIDLERGYLHLPDSKTGQKVIHLSPPAQDLLSNLPKVKGNPFVIVGDREGSHWVNLRKPWERIKTKACNEPTTLPDGSRQHVRLHDLRHNFASLAASGGASLLMIGTLLGHRQISTTARYAHLTDDPLKQVNDAAGKTAEKALKPAVKSHSDQR